MFSACVGDMRNHRPAGGGDKRNHAGFFDGFGDLDRTAFHPAGIEPG